MHNGVLRDMKHISQLKDTDIFQLTSFDGLAYLIFLILIPGEVLRNRLNSEPDSDFWPDPERILMNAGMDPDRIE